MWLVIRSPLASIIAGPFIAAPLFMAMLEEKRLSPIGLISSMVTKRSALFAATFLVMLPIGLATYMLCLGFMTGVMGLEQNEWMKIFMYPGMVLGITLVAARLHFIATEKEGQKLKPIHITLISSIFLITAMLRFFAESNLHSILPVVLIASTLQVACNVFIVIVVAEANNKEKLHP